MLDTLTLNHSARALFNQLAWAVARVEGVAPTYFYWSDVLHDTVFLMDDAVEEGQTVYVMVRDGGTHTTRRWSEVTRLLPRMEWLAILTVRRNRFDRFTIRAYDPALPIDTAA